jgi:hypothetical protein
MAILKLISSRGFNGVPNDSGIPGNSQKFFQFLKNSGEIRGFLRNPKGIPKIFGVLCLIS